MLNLGVSPYVIIGVSGALDPIFFGVGYANFSKFLLLREIITQPFKLVLVG